MTRISPAVSQDPELVAEFITEANEGLANVEAQLLAIEEDLCGNSETVNAVFRTVHSIKGTAGFLELGTIEKLSHNLEQVLNHVRNAELQPGTAETTVLLQCLDRLKRLIDDLENSEGADISQEQTALDGICRQVRGVADAPVANTTTDVPPEAAASSPAAEAVREFIIECQESLDAIDRDLLELERNPRATETHNRLFRALHTIKGSSGFLGFGKLESIAHAAESLLGQLREGVVYDGTQVAGVMLAVVDSVRQIVQHVEGRGDEGDANYDLVVRQLQELHAAQRSVAAAASQAVLPGQPDARSVDSPAPASTAASAAPVAAHPTGRTAGLEAEPRSAAASESTIRVDVGLLDRLMTRVGELVLARNQILQHVARQADAGFTSTAQRLNLITTELQEGVMKTRMQPIGNVWSKFPRVVRDLALQLGKQVRIEMQGKETELDKTIIEAIKDPLTHLVRNSVDHGIESPEARRAAGKQAEGCLILRAYHEGGQVNIEIADDGAGLKIDRIRARALQRGLVTPEQAARMSDKDFALLIFAPGFSTTDTVTNLSGRGVGMDVVRANIEKIGGTVDLSSELGRGTTIKIRIPLTLAIIPALLVTSDGDRFAIPQVSLLELVRLEGADVRTKLEQLPGALLYRLRGRLLPLVWLRSELQLASADEAHALCGAEVVNIVVLRADDREFGLIVDTINDTEEIVVKPLAKQLSCIPVYAGATILGDGQVALILDVSGLGQRAGIAAIAEDHHSDAAAANARESQNLAAASQTLLVLQVGSQPLALPMSSVTRLEKIDRAAVEKSGQQDVVQYRDQILPLVRLADMLSIESNESLDRLLDVVVLGDGPDMVGIVVDRVIDIVETTLQVHRKCSRDGLLGTAVVQGRVTDLLDLPSLQRHIKASHSEQPKTVCESR